MGGTEDPLTCLLLPLIVLILEEVLVLMGENKLILIRAAASHLVNDLLTPHQTHSHSNTQRTMDSRMVFKCFFYSETPK